MKLRTILLPALLALAIAVFSGCQEKGRKKGEPASEPDTEKTTSTTTEEATSASDSVNAPVAEETKAAPLIVDTLQTTEGIEKATKPGSYVFISDKGNHFTFDVAGEMEESTDAAEACAGKACDNLYFDGCIRPTVKKTAAVAELENDMNPKTVFTKLWDMRLGPELVFPDRSRELVERRNLEFKMVFIYAFSRQTDEDYHLIMGTSADVKKAIFFTAEISGIPAETNSYGRGNIIKARKDFEDWFRLHGSCATGYANNDWRKNPVRVMIRGSLFYDKQHSGASRIGPQTWPGIKITSAWEIHPVTFIKFYD